MNQIVVGVVGSGTASAILLVSLVIHNRALRSARLIWDNRIVVVPSAILYDKKRQSEPQVEETVLSTFGLIRGGTIYEWGRHGLRGVRLQAMAIDGDKLSIRFGNEHQVMQVEFLHGIVDKQQILDVEQKVWRETGVKASIKGW